MGPVVVGILMIVVGRMRFTPAMFILVGLLFVMSCYMSAAPFAIIAGFVVLGIVTLLRKDSRILAGVSILLFALLITLITIGVTGVICTIIEFIGFVILLHICFALCNEDVLKLI